MPKKRDIGAELLQGVQEIKAGSGKRYRISKVEDIQSIREHMHLSQMAFAGLMGVSVRTIQEWEQGRRSPSGAAQVLLKIAANYPEVFSKLKKAA
jgi:putative transcriptional regulator